VTLGDVLNGIEAEHTFKLHDLHLAARWLAEAACEHHPEIAVRERAPDAQAFVVSRAPCRLGRGTAPPGGS